MPHKSKRISNLTMIVGGAFAFLLIMSNILLSQQKASERLLLPGGSMDFTSGTGLVTGVSDQIDQAQNIEINTDNWKSYRDPTYHFEIKYPSEWAEPISQKINDPDFAYNYQVSFGTPETLKGNGIEGFAVFVYKTDKCSAVDSSNNYSCASQKTVISNGATVPGNIFEFTSKVYTYTIVPIIPESGTDPVLARKVNSITAEASKNFTFDSTLKLFAPSTSTLKSQSSSAVSANISPARGSRSGGLTGAIPTGGGRFICPHPSRKPMRSPNKGNHVDEDCCPDPDEWPNSLCIYKPSDYKIMLKP